MVLARGFSIVRVAACRYGLDAVLGMLEICGGDDHRVHVLAIVELFIVARGCDSFTGYLLQIGDAFFAALLPDIRDGPIRDLIP
jgi:hypothetical protein